MNQLQLMVVSCEAKKKQQMRALAATAVSNLYARQL